MNLLNSIEMSARGLSAERTRLNVASMNLANAHVTRTLDGGPYRAKSVIFRAVPFQPEGAQADPDNSSPFAATLAEKMQNLQSVEVSQIVDDPEPFQEVYDPSHPDADANGIVRMPNVNVMEQMTDMMTASRAYEAGVTAINTAKSMAMKALDIGR